MRRRRCPAFRSVWPALLVAALVGIGGCARSQSPGNAPLQIERSIPLPGVAGRIDHLAYDPKHGRIFIAELGNGTVEAVDLATGRSVGRIGGLKEPQGLAVLADHDEFAVASGGDGTVRFFRTTDLAPVSVLSVGGDADNLRVQLPSGRLVVGYGSGALAVIDPASHGVVSTTALPAHPEGFQIDGDRAYVNLPDAGAVAAVDLAAGKIIATWRNPGPKWNFPLALASGADLMATVYRLPGRLVIWNRSGAVKQSLKTCGDADDVFFDPPRRRIYVICGAGMVDVFRLEGAAYAHEGEARTSSGARTGLFVPQLDRLFVAARAQGGVDAALLVLRPAP